MTKSAESNANSDQLWQVEYAHTMQGQRDQTDAGGGGTDAGDGDDGDDDDDAARPELTRGQLLRIASGMLGLMFGWATKTVLTTPLFRDVYGVDPADLGFVWVAGPLSGLVVQPVVGVISDHREGQGQRSFFFAAGTIVMAASLALLPAAGAVCSRLSGGTFGGVGGVDGDGGGNSTWLQRETTEEGAHGVTGIGLAVFSLWMLDLAMNASLVAIRAVVADCAPARQQPEANTVIIISYGAGTLLGYGLGAVDAASWLLLPPGPFWKSCVDFWVAAFVLLLTSVVATREAYRLERPRVPRVKQQREGRSSWQSSSSPPYVAVAEVGEDSGAEEAQLEPHGTRMGTRRQWAVLGDGGGGVDADADAGADVGVLRDEGDAEGDEALWSSSPPAPTSIKVTSALRVQPRGVACIVGCVVEKVFASCLPTARLSSCSSSSGSALTCSSTSICLVPIRSVPPGGMQGKLLDMALFYAVPPWLLPVCLLLFFSWIGWFAIFIFGSDWVGVNVFGGDPSAASGSVKHEAYDGGVSWASVGLAAQASLMEAVVITVMGCGPVTLLVRLAGLKGAFMTAVAVQAACLLCAALLRPGPSGRALSFLLLAALGVPLALVESLPYMMVGMFSPRETHGQLLGKLNVWIVLAQLALTLCVHPIVEHSKDGDSAVLLAGAIAAAAGALFVPAIGKGGAAAGKSAPPGSLAPSTVNGTGDESPSSPDEGLLEGERQ
ncbi:unnamed protein product [Scytosiphon promiscuus]